MPAGRSCLQSFRVHGAGIGERGEELPRGDRGEEHEGRPDGVKPDDEEPGLDGVLLGGHAVVALDQGPVDAAPRERVEDDEVDHVEPPKAGLGRGHVEVAFGGMVGDGGKAAGLGDG